MGKVTEGQLKGEHGTRDTVIVDGVVMNKSDAVGSADSDFDKSGATKAQLKAELDRLDIDYPPDATKAELLSLLP